MDHSTSASESETDDFEKKEETAQQWVYRHLIEFTDCDEESAKKLVDGDCSPLIQLLTDVEQKKSLFITVTVPTKVNFFEALVPPPPPEPVPVVPKKVKLQKLKKKNKKQTKKAKKIKIKKKSKEIVNPVEPPPQAIDNLVDMIFEWWTLEDLPHHEQFIFIIPNGCAKNSETKFDDLYHVGYMKNRRMLKASLSCLEFLFNEKTNFNMKVDLLLHINDIEDKKIPSDLIFERFIIDNLARNFNMNGRVRNSDLDARSLILVLSQTLQTFCLRSEMSERPRLLTQLSYLDIEYLIQLPDKKVTAVRFERALTHLSLLQYLYKDEVSEWTRKTFLHLLDLFSTILAQEITKKSNYMTNYSPDMKVVPICSSFKQVVKKLVLVSREIFESQEDWSATNKISFSFYIVGILEEEIDSIIKKVEEMNNENRDMSLDRNAIKAMQVILKELDEFLQEKCLESAVESGNLESLRSLAATIVKHNKRLERVIALY